MAAVTTITIMYYITVKIIQLLPTIYTYSLIQQYFYKICDKCGKGTYIDFVCFHRIKYDFFDKMRLYKISL